MTGTAIALKLNLDDESLEVLRDLAGGQRCSLEEYITAIVRKAIKSEVRSRRKVQTLNEAPMDAFLPEGANPFDVHEVDGQHLASSFADVQARMRFAGTPSLFRD